jgi:hypothetical protein
MPALAHQFARLVGSFHGTFSAARKTRVFCSLSGQTQFRCGCAICAAYTGPLWARQCDAPRLAFHLLAGISRLIRGEPSPLRSDPLASVHACVRKTCPAYEICVTGRRPGDRARIRRFQGCRSDRRADGHAGKRTQNTYLTRGLTQGEARRIIERLRHGH